MNSNEHNESQKQDDEYNCALEKLLRVVGQLGLAVHPNNRNNHHSPILRWTEKFSESREEILAWVNKYSTYSFGVTLAQCTETYIVLDVDVKNGKDGFYSLRNYADFDEADLRITFAVKTPSGGMHYWFNSESPLKSKIDALDGIDLLGCDRRVIAPWSISTDGKKYEVSQDLNVQIAPNWLISLLEDETTREVLPTPVVTREYIEDSDLDELRYLLERLSPNVSYHPWMRASFAALNEFGDSQNVIDLLEQWSAKGSKFDKKDFDRLIDSYQSDSSNKVGLPTLYWLLKLYPNFDRSIETLPAASGFEQLADQAYSYTIGIMEKYGNELSTEHREDINRICEAMIRGIFSEDSFRISVPLYTGGGKTSCIKGVIKAIENTRYSLVIAVGTVNEQSALKKDLIDLGVSGEKVGIYHKSTKEEHSDIESISRGEISATQFLIITHNRVKAYNFDVKEFHQYQGMKRSLCIWDEAMITTVGEVVELKYLVRNIAAWLEGYRYNLVYESRNEEGDEVWQNDEEDHLEAFFVKCIKLFKEKMRLGDTIFYLPELPILLTLARSIVRKVMKESGPLETLIEWGSRQDAATRLFEVNQGYYLARFNQVVPDELDQVLVLDASSAINRLQQLDQSIKVLPSISQKDYSKVNLDVVDSYASRTKFKEREYLDKAVSVVAEYVEIMGIKDELLIYGFKEKDFEYQDKLRWRISNGDLEGKIHFLTQGNERGINDFSRIKNMIIFGVPYRSDQDIAAQIIAQYRNDTFLVTNDMVKDVQMSLIADLFNQAIGRGNCRNISNGYAGEMRILMFLPTRDKEVLRLLSQVMPNINIQEHKTNLLPTTSKVKIQDEEEISKRILRYLRAKRPRNVSYRSLREHLAPDTNSNSREWRNSKALIESDLGREYTKVRSSLVRTDIN